MSNRKVKYLIYFLNITDVGGYYDHKTNRLLH